MIHKTLQKTWLNKGCKNSEKQTKKVDQKNKRQKKKRKTKKKQNKKKQIKRNAHKTKQNERKKRESEKKNFSNDFPHVVYLFLKQKRLSTIIFTLLK